MFGMVQLLTGFLSVVESIDPEHKAAVPEAAHTDIERSRTGRTEERFRAFGRVAVGYGNGLVLEDIVDDVMGGFGESFEPIARAWPLSSMPRISSSSARIAEEAGTIRG